MVAVLTPAQHELIEHTRQIVDETVQRIVNRTPATGKLCAKNWRTCYRALRLVGFLSIDRELLGAAGFV
jgi:hypothetical protein